MTVHKHYFLTKYGTKKTFMNSWMFERESKVLIYSLKIPDVSEYTESGKT